MYHRRSNWSWYSVHSESRTPTDPMQTGHQLHMWPGTCFRSCVTSLPGCNSVLFCRKSAAADTRSTVLQCDQPILWSDDHLNSKSHSPVTWSFMYELSNRDFAQKALRLLSQRFYTSIYLNTELISLREGGYIFLRFVWLPAWIIKMNFQKILELQFLNKNKSFRLLVWSGSWCVRYF